MASSVTQPLRAPGGLLPAQPTALAAVVEYGTGAVVSRTLAKGRAGTLTVFAFDRGQELSEHSAPFDAYVLVLEGSMELKIGGTPLTARMGEAVLMPANVPHALQARERCKMLLTMLRDPPAA
ncbi:MAG: cupin domain-containing protein [Proteobacteria bacterium]|nr:cupin domain-containing protein [Pseudomonadota bacterium]